ncbi:MutS-related protein [Marinitoga lauensis]|uniref:MutS-related protein n=1 Tax=Marinitoga lauensis TaxID=2201189 RepID=UPI0010120804|nr:DNA mismatch repair protein MutS [Marinitoga lauensis]
MKVYLLYKNMNFNVDTKLPENYDELIVDFRLEPIFKAMSLNDDLVEKVSKKVILSYEKDIDTILYRQNIIKDCLKNPQIIKDLYNLATSAIENRQKYRLGIFISTPSSILNESINLLKMFLIMLKTLKNIADKNSTKFESDGFKNFFQNIKSHLNNEFFILAEKQLKDLTFENGIFIQAKLGKGNKGTDYVLIKRKKRKFLEKFLSKNILSKNSYTFFIHPRDDSGFETLSDIKNYALNHVSNALAQSSDHILDFFKQLQLELAFYIGVINLYYNIKNKGIPISFPIPAKQEKRTYIFKELYELSLLLSTNKTVISNDLNADNKDIIVITGANQGGKTTFLRSLGIVQLLMQSGIFVPAKYFTANISNKIFSHFTRGEDKKMESGKLEEELIRLNKIINNIEPNSIIFFNETFSSTNEKEGSELAKGIIKALIEKKMKIIFVTHLYEFSNYFFNKKLNNFIFLRAERGNNGIRTFKILEGKPLPTSYGKDLYIEIFKKNEEKILF